MSRETTLRDKPVNARSNCSPDRPCGANRRSQNVMINNEGRGGKNKEKTENAAGGAHEARKSEIAEQPTQAKQ